LTMPLELETEAQEWFERYSTFGRGFRRAVFDRNSLNPLAAGRAGAGANMALRRSVTQLVGLFDEALDAGTPTRSGGDTEMFSHILSSGYRIVYDPAALSWHRHRRSWEELRQTLYGYGVGVYALWTRKLLLERELTVPKLAWSWFWRTQVPALVSSLLRRPASMPLDLLLAELRGCAVGPWAYLSSRRRLQRKKITQLCKVSQQSA
jgi:GT2 family glycosyltransferase